MTADRADVLLSRLDRVRKTGIGMTLDGLQRGGMRHA